MKTILSVAHQGLRDWIVQRISALLMTGYTVLLLVYIFRQHPLTFVAWHAFFSCLWIKIITTIVLFALLWHAWIGIWTIVTDYVKWTLVRSILHVFIYLTLAAYFIWGVANVFCN